MGKTTKAITDQQAAIKEFWKIHGRMVKTSRLAAIKMAKILEKEGLKKQGK